MNSIKTAMVTGGAGFIGSHLVELLVSKGIHVTVYDNFATGKLSNLDNVKSSKYLQVIQGSILDQELLNSSLNGIDNVFHLAGIGEIVPSISNPLRYMQVNVIGTANLMESARKAGVKRVVYAASSSCYGLANTPTDENEPIDLRHPYALSKFQGEVAALGWGKIYGVEVNSIRIFNAYGRRVRTSGDYGAVMGVFLKQKIAGAPLTIVGDGSQLRDFLHVRDVAEAFYLAGVTESFGRIWNLGAGNPQSVQTLAGYISEDVIYIPHRPGEPLETHADISKVKCDLGWEPKVTFEEGIKEILENLDEWSDAPLWTPDLIATATREWFEILESGIE
jgi:UDP-glucose 4-epimerase